jgi:ketosteroid isomerase-like protein
MSQEEKIELVRNSLEAFERGDVEAALANAHPDLVTTRVHPDGAVFHGIDGFRQLLADWLEGFSESSFQSDEKYIEAGDYVIVHQHQQGRGAGSGALVEGDFWLLYGFAEGKVIRLDIYADKHEALEATGMHGVGDTVVRPGSTAGSETRSPGRIRP